MTSAFLPYGRQSIDDDDVAAVVAALRGEFLTTGPAVETFECEFAAAVGAPHAVAVANGTAALHLAVLALGLGPGDAAIVPAVTFMATANAARYVGAEVVFADVDPETGLMGADHLDAALRRVPACVAAKAVLPVHLGGAMVDSTAIAMRAREAGLAIVEDSCHALGSTRIMAGRAVRAGDCAHADAATFSFHPVKTVTTAEGGMITTAHEDLARRLRLLRSHGIERDPARMRDRAEAFATDGKANPWYHEMEALGFNYRLPDVLAALGTSQLRRLNAFAARRRALVRRYGERLAPLAPCVLPPAGAALGDPVLHLYAVRVDFAAAGIDRGRLMRELATAGIGTQVHYTPVYRQPHYEDRNGRQRLDGAERYYARTLSLPLHAGMTDADVDRVVAALAAAIGGAGAVSRRAG